MTVRVKLNPAGFDALRKSPEVVAVISAMASRISAAAPGCAVSAPKMGRKRARVRVYTATHAARVAESEGHALLRAIDAGR